MDALVTLAAADELDAARLGGDLSELLALGTVRPSRLGDALRTAAATGACATTRAAKAAVLPAPPALLTTAGDPRGTGELLATATDCVEEAGASSPEPAGLAGVVAPGGRSRLVTEAGRLREALRRNREG
ncbi:hypothetical protein ACFY7H_22740 [Streptomyces sp. NPDC012794]|uniref:hypothetical protein n=1 Tax=Streptomyces sp. NPDC012794 TaxID=3364850 RepID=UPI00367F02D6